jgi:hypothetical protein
VAADPVLDCPEIARLLGARLFPFPARAFQGLIALTWRLRLQPSPRGWADLALGAPLMDSARARGELGWEPRRTASEAFCELLDGLRSGAGDATPPLDPATAGPARIGEVTTGLGTRE